MKGLDLSKFKKVSSDENKTVFKHEDGHFLHVSHEKLKPGHVKELGKLQRLAEGGEVKKKDKVSDMLAPVQQFVDRNTDKGPKNYADGGEALNDEALDALSGNTQVEAGEPATQMQDTSPIGDSLRFSALKGYSPDTMQQAVSQEPPVPQQIPQAEALDYGPAPQQQMMQQAPQQDLAGLHMMQQGLRASAAAQGALGEENSRTLDAHQQHLERIAKENAGIDENYSREHQALVDDIASNRIDPDRYFKTMGAGGKVATAVGLILGGLGGAATHGRNLAVDAINDNISRDLEAQKAEAGKKTNLLSAMERHYGDSLVARNAAHSVQLEMVKTELLKNQNKAATPMAQAQLQSSLGLIQNQIDTLNRQNSTRLQALNAVKSGHPDAIAQAIPFLIPEKHQAKALQELDEIKTIDEHAQTLDKTMDKVAKLQTGLGRANPQKKSDIDALNLQIDALGKDIFGRLNETELQRLDNAKIKYIDGPEQIQNKKDVVQFLINKARNKNSALSMGGINIPPPVRTKPIK